MTLSNSSAIKKSNDYYHQLKYFLHTHQQLYMYVQPQEENIKML